MMEALNGDFQKLIKEKDTDFTMGF